MKAAVFEIFGGPLVVGEVPDPTPAPDAAIISVRANGICRSDWHGWMGHDPTIRLPHVPGHELAGVVEAVGARVEKWRPGARVTTPFVNGCGRCAECFSGNHQVCEQQTQPGFTHWGAFAEYVEVHQADLNLVGLPDSIDFVAAASLGCRYVTSFRGVVVQGRVAPGEWVAVHGCGGVGLSAIQIASAAGARVVAVDIREDALTMARGLGADEVLNASNGDDIAATIRELSSGGADLSVDALGSSTTCRQSILCLRPRGRHVQIGLLTGDDSDPGLPMHVVIGRELQIVGSHGMQAHAYPQLLRLIEAGRLDPAALVTGTVSLQQAPAVLQSMTTFANTGVTVIDRF